MRDSAFNGLESFKSIHLAQRMTLSTGSSPFLFPLSHCPIQLSAPVCVCVTGWHISPTAQTFSSEGQLVVVVLYCWRQWLASLRWIAHHLTTSALHWTAVILTATDHYHCNYHSSSYSIRQWMHFCLFASLITATPLPRPFKLGLFLLFFAITAKLQVQIIACAHHQHCACCFKMSNSVR